MNSSVRLPGRRFWTFALGAMRLVGVPVVLVWALGQLSAMDQSRVAIASPAFLGAALVINEAALAIFALRMRLVLSLCGIRISWRDGLRIHLQSLFYFFAVPTGAGMEIARFVKIRALDPSATPVRLSLALLIDRFLGAASGLTVSVLCLPFVADRVSVSMSPAAWIAIVTGGSLISLAGLMWLRTQRGITDAVTLAHDHWRRVVSVCSLAVVMHVIFTVGVFVAAQAIALPVTLLDTMFAVSAGMLLMVIPISLGGLGPAEAGAAGIFLVFGYDLSIAITAGAIPYLARLAGAVQGGAWEMVESASAILTSGSEGRGAKHAENRSTS